jgi:hypothetical protein
MDPKGRMFSPRTIVGSRPPDHPGIPEDVPRGIEVLLRKAAVDAEFRDRLVTDPKGAATSIGLALSPGEKAILGSVPADALTGMIDRVEVPDEHQSVFRGRIAAAMLALVAGTAFACAPPGIAPGGCVVHPDEQRREQPADPEDGQKEDEEAGETDEDGAEEPGEDR